MRTVVVVLAALAVPASIHAQTHGTTAVPVAPVETGMKPAQKALLVGSLLIAANMLDDEVRSGAQSWRNPTSNSLARIGNTFGTGQLVFPALIGAWVAGSAFGSDGVRRASGHAIVAATAAGLTATALKWTVGRLRPSSGFDSDHFHHFQFKDSSFPSGHTSIAFGVASSLSRDIKGRWDDVALYGAASLTGLARMNDNKHWFSDVVGGAVVGILAGKWATRGNRSIAASPSGVTLSLEF
jgi:membrane-associated phospholipid phosphatase